MNETFHEQTDDELAEKELKQIEADDQSIQNILLGLPKDIYAAVDSCEIAQEIWLILVPGVANQNSNGNGNVVAVRAEGNAIRNNVDLDEIEEVNANYILMANLQQASTSGTQTDKALVYDSDGSAEVHNYDNCYDNEVFNMFTQEEQYTELLEPILEPHQVQQNDSNVIFEVSNMEQDGGTVDQHPATVFEQKNTTKGKSVNTQFCKQSILGKPPSSRGSKLYDVTPFPKSKGLPRIYETHALSKPVTSNSVPTLQELKVVKNDNVIAPGMFRINPFKLSREEKFVPNKVRARVENTAKTRRPLPRSNTKNDRVPSASKSSCNKNKEVENDKSKVVCSMCKQCLINANHDVCVFNYVNDMNSRGKKLKANVSNTKTQKKQKPKVMKPKKVGSNEILASPKPSKPRYCLRVYFIEGLRHNLFSVGQFCDSNLEVAFRRNTCFVRNLKRVDLLKGNRKTNLYTINLYEMASTSSICLMARATSTKLWLWHQHLSHLNFGTINDLAKNDLVTGLPKFKYHKEHLCPSCEQRKSKRVSRPPKPVPNSKQRLHLLHIDLCGLMRITSINGKRYVLVIIDDYSRYTWVHSLRSKDETPEVIKTFLKRINVLLQSPVIIIRTNNGIEFKNQILKEYFDSVGISHQTSFVRTLQQNGVVEQ
nr:retrovirus-related Pol polyprotein from transposon TNT 1-94 [Tanacetum cinerariifolium]